MKEHFSAKIKLFFDKKREKGLKIVLMMRIVGMHRDHLRSSHNLSPLGLKILGDT